MQREDFEEENDVREKPHTCSACGQLLASKEELRTHRREAHGMITPLGRSSLGASIASLALRGFLGTVMILHGIPKLGKARKQTIEHMEKVGVSKEATTATSLLEVIGGASLIVGFMVPVVSSLFAAEMAGTTMLNKNKMGKQFLSGGGKPFYELDVAYLVGFATLALIGGRDFSVD